jgi:hypothetical protein
VPTAVTLVLIFSLGLLAGFFNKFGDIFDVSLEIGVQKPDGCLKVQNRDLGRSSESFDGIMTLVSFSFGCGRWI